MRAAKSRPSSLLAAAFAALAVSAVLGAPTVVADPATIDCEGGQIVIDGQCNVGAVDPNVVVPVDRPDGVVPVMGEPDMGGGGMGEPSVGEPGMGGDGGGRGR
jgi:hypothetical protein